VGGCVVISDKAQRTRKWALSWAQYRRRDTRGGDVEIATMGLLINIWNVAQI